MAKEGLFDRLVQHQVSLERAKAGEVLRIKKILSKLDNDIEREILRLPANYTQRQLNSLIKRISNQADIFYAKTVQTSLNEIAETVVSFETEFAFETARDFLQGGAATKRTNPITTLKRVNSEKYQGHRLATWNRRLGRDKSKRVESQLRTIAASKNKGVDNLLVGAKKAMRVSNSNSQGITRAYFDQASNFARDDVYLQNDDRVKQIIWSSILDSRTTLICAARSNLRYDAITKEPIGHNLEWGEGVGRIHFGCRSIGIPVDEEDIITSGSGKDFKFQDGTKTAFGADEDYERGDNKNSQGRVYKNATKDNFLEKQLVDANTNYETWLRRQPKPFIQDTLGVNRAERFLKRKEPLSSFVVPNGTELTVKQLNKKLGKL